MQIVKYVAGTSLHLGHVIAHQYFKNSMRKCVRILKRSGYESAFKIVRTNDRGLIFTQVMEGMTGSVDPLCIEKGVPFRDEVQGGEKQRAALLRVSLADGAIFAGGDTYANIERGEGRIFDFHTHPRTSLPIFSHQDLKEVSVFYNAISRGLAPIIAAGTVFWSSSNEVLCVLFLRCPNRISILNARDNVRFLQEGLVEVNSRTDILDLFSGNAMFLDFPIVREYSIHVTDDILQKASQMLIFRA